MPYPGSGPAPYGTDVLHTCIIVHTYTGGRARLRSFDRFVMVPGGAPQAMAKKGAGRPDSVCRLFMVAKVKLEVITLAARQMPAGGRTAWAPAQASRSQAAGSE